MGFCGDEPFTVWHNDSGDFSKCFEDSVVMTLPAIYLLIFGMKRLYYLENKKPDLFTLKQLFQDFQTWRKTLQLEVIVSILLVAWKILFFIVIVSIYNKPFEILYSVVTVVQWTVSLGLVYLEMKKGQSRSWEIRLYWVFAFFVATVKLRTLTLAIAGKSIYNVGFLEYFSYFVGYCLILILSITSVLFFDNLESYQNLEENEISKEVNANLFSRLTFWWINSVLVKGHKKALEISDVPTLGEIDQSILLSEKFEKAWEEQLKKPNPSLPWALAKAFGPHFYIAALFKIIQDLLIFVGPTLLKRVLGFVESRDGSQDTYDGLIYALLYFLAPVVQSLLLHQYFHRCYRVGMWLRSAVVTAVYKKALKTSLREGTTIGEIVNLMSVDAQKFMDLCPYLHMIWSAPLQLAISLVLLYRILNASVFAGLGIMLVMIPINLAISNLAKKRQTISMKLKDRRTKAVNEVLNGIKVIKLYSWEQSFMDHVNEIRNKELDVMKAIKYIQGFSLLLWSMSPVFVSVSTFTVYILTGQVLSATQAFPALSLFNVMQFPINMLPSVVSSIIEASVSVARLQKFLLKKDLDPNVVEHHINEPGIAVKIDNATLEWEPNKPILHDINLTIKKGELVAIVGQVGSGKSSIVSSLVGDLDKTKGTVAVNGSVALVSQQAWIQNATLKNNILFAKELNQDKYQSVVQACCLEPDIKILPGGDQTEIGEKGINLSGGQKQRVSIARAVYNNADIYIFDDPLSAVDAHVGKAIFKNVLSNQDGILCNKTRILVTHAVHYLPYVDRIILMKDGRIVEEGDFNTLIEAGSHFTELMSHDEQQQQLQQQQAPDKSSDSNEQIGGGDNKESENNEEQNEEEEGENENLLEKVLRKSRSRSPSPSSNRNIDGDDIASGSILQTTRTPEEDEQDERELMEDIDIDGGENIQTPLQKGEKSSVLKQPLRLLKKLPTSINKKLNNSGSGVSLKPITTVNAKPQDKNKIISVETKQEGKVSFKIYLSYFKAIGVLLATCIIGFYVLTQLLSILANWWISIWTNSYGGNGNGSGSGSISLSSSSTVEDNEKAKYYLSIYVAFSCGTIAATFLRSFSMVFGSIKGSKLFHEKMFKAVILSPMSFFDTTPIGRILNRFSKDQLTIDESIARTLGMFLNTFCQVVGSIIVIAWVSPFIILAMVPVGALFYFIQKYYLNSSRELTRLEGVSRSPIYAHFSETLAGVTTIRAFKDVARFVTENERLLDENQKCYYINISSNRWLAIRLEFLGACLVSCAVLYTVLARSRIEAGTAGLVITYALAITGNMNWMVRMSCDLENSVVSIERIQEYCLLPSKAPLFNDKSVPMSWPSHGKIVFKNLWLTYREGLDPVLRGINCTIEPKTKVGIVGRTGAGKSSLTQALFRLVEPLRGTIEIDGIDITELGLNPLRSRMAIIPQDPVLFAGSVRYNLDPFDQYDDHEIWEAIENAHLLKAIKDLDGGLDAMVQDGGDNFSVGQRQLLVIGRALLKKANIIVLDEASSSIDIASDALIQETIRTKFADCTVLTIAHRLGTIADSDKIMVLDKGELIEYDSPSELLKNQDSIYYSLVKASESKQNINNDDESN
nr:ABC transporter ABCC.8 [Dictyostelium discoideum]